ncbi:hypothetical protein SAMN04488123_106150 [Natribacillus halophilus]|uniref:Uncharacterized protein n=1 Tax=Natribacillus halophilus TaxID=549003 RepID=A0A1G8NM93_9BACI|nr:hypothetical protein SAMN04488123_106150 [Natribacillus halophilus]
MSLSMQTSAVLNGDDLLLPDINLTVEKGEPAVIQGDIEWLESFHSLLLTEQDSKNLFVLSPFS